MKAIARIFAWTTLVLLSVGIALAQEAPARVITYQGGPDASTKRPDFKNALIAIDFPDPVGKVTTLFRRLGASQFVIGHNPCVYGRPLICVRITVGSPMEVSSSGSIGGYGNRGGYQTGGSFSGSMYPVTLHIFLVGYDKKDGGNRPTTPLGEATCLAPAGSGSSFSSSYGSTGGGMYSSTSSNDLDASIGNAVNQDLNALLSKNAFKKFLAWGTPAQWIPGANLAVENAFVQQ